MNTEKRMQLTQWCK